MMPSSEVMSFGQMEDRVVGVLNGFVGTLVSRSIVECVKNSGDFAGGVIGPSDVPALMGHLEKGVKAFVADKERQAECCEMLRDVLSQPASQASAGPENIVVRIDREYDIVTARGQCRTLCAEIGFAPSHQIKVATVVSELARNIVQYAGSGRIELNVLDKPKSGIEIIAVDQGAGIADLDSILAGTYRSSTGMGMGLCGTKNLMDEFEVESEPGKGTHVRTRKYVA